ncbi:MAG: glycosyltransferase [Pirellulales bacterium]
MKNALIFTQSFPPTNVVSARRFGYLSLHMARLGWQPWIVTMNGSGPLSLPIDETTIFRFGQHPHQTDEGSTRGPSRTSEYLATAGKLCARKLGLRYSAVTPANWQWYNSVLARRRGIRLSMPKIDLVLGSYAPEHALWLARRFSEEIGAPWVADFRDLAALYAPDQRGVIRWLDRKLERSLMRSAAHITTVSPTLAEALQTTYQRPATVIFNGWDTADQDAPGCESVCDLPTDPYLFYAGRLYRHRMASVVLLLEALRQSPGVHFRFRSLGPTDLENEIREHAVRLGISQNVHILPPAEPAQIKIESRAALANVVVEDLGQVDRYSAGNLTGKFLKLLALEPPVICIARPDSDTGPILEQTGKGRLSHLAGDVIDFIRAASQPRHPFVGSKTAIERFRSVEQAQNLCDLFDRIVDSSPSRCDITATAKAA